MLISENWLKELIDLNWSNSKLCDALTFSGLEVEGVKKLGPDFSSVIVGEVIHVEQHPNADRLKLTRVDIGDNEPLNIVCGASNVREGIKVGCARVGAVLPNDFKIKKTKIRGEISEGMLVSGEEIGIEVGGETEILELESKAVVGTNLLDYLQINDNQIEISITPNRGDCFSVLGIARELSAISGVNMVSAEPQPTLQNASSSDIKINNFAPELCPKFSACIVKNFDTNAKTPQWLITKLNNSGLSSINLLVDLTNLVMLEIGQPMHAFDYDLINGDVSIRLAKASEKLILLNDLEVQLDTSDLLICDESGPISLAGVMGGKSTAVNKNTNSVLFEAAHFIPSAIRGKSRKVNVKTDAAHRFERGVDPRLPEIALNKAVKLLLEIAGGNASQLITYKSDAFSWTKPSIILRKQKIKKTLGVEIPDEKVEGVLTALGCELCNFPNAQYWQVQTPSWRFDLEQEVDLIEELIRIIGYDYLPLVKPNTQQSISTKSEEHIQIKDFKQTLLNLGFYEAITYSFVNENKQSLLYPNLKQLNLVNPISNDQSSMRTNLLVGLFSTLAYNLNRQAKNLKFFENGLCFNYDEAGELQQNMQLAGALCGTLLPEQWAIKPKKIDFFDVKGIVEQLLSYNHNIALEFVNYNKLPYDQEQAMEVKIEGVSVGKFGKINSNLTNKFGIRADTFAFEIEFSKLNKNKVKSYKKVSAFPEIRRDLSLIVPNNLNIGELVQFVEKARLKWLKEVLVFDVYFNSDNNLTSVGLGLIFQDLLSTLTDEKVDKQINNLLKALDKSLSIKLKE